MRAIILAAGRGRRLEAMGWMNPKCLLPIGGTTLLDNLLDSLQGHSLEEIVIVVGYRQEVIRDHVVRRGLAATYIENPDYDTTNTINSLWRARRHLDDDFLYFNADVWFPAALIDRLVAEPGTRLALDRKSCGEEEVKVIVDADGRILRIGKQLDPVECAGEFVGIAKFAATGNAALIEALRRRNVERKDVNLFFEAAVDDILSEVTMHVVDVSDLASMEIDFPEDYRAALGLAPAAAEEAPGRRT